MRLATRLRGGATRVLTFEPASVRRASSASTGAPSAASGDELDAVYRTLLDVSDREQRIHITDAQQTAVHCATKGYSVFLHLPTGAGKSLAFQAPALAAPPGKTTLVVSPLIALMHVRGIDAVYLLLVIMGSIGIVFMATALRTHRTKSTPFDARALAPSKSLARSARRATRHH